MQYRNFIFLLTNCYLLISVDCAQSFGTINDTIPNIDVRIVGGETVIENEIPWQISLQIFALLNDITCLMYKNQWIHYCGGSIITNNMVVTAGHCIDQVDPRKFSVVAGTIDRRSITVPRYFVNRTILHEGYNLQTVSNDIGLVELQDPFEFSTSVSPIRYDCSITVIPNMVCVTSGWGYYLTRDPTGTCLGINTLLSNNLQKISLTITASQVCGGSFGIDFPDTQICTAGETLRGPCGGDSGGPLMIADTTEGNCLVGITSYGGQNCIQGLPAAFTRVSSYIEWIKANI